MLPSSFMFYVLDLSMFPHLCFVVCNRASISHHPLSSMLPRTSTRFYRANRYFVACVNTFPLKKTVISFPISQRIEKMVFFVNKQSQGKSKKIISSQFEFPPIYRNGSKGLTIVKSNFYEKMSVRKKRREIHRLTPVFAAREKNFHSPGEKASKIRLPPLKKPTYI